MAKKRKIKNMTRAEHKRTLEGAARNQVAAMREARGQVFLPKLNKSDGKSEVDMYDRVVKAGQALVEGHALPGSRTERIISYYSREDVQQALYHYAKGRKISVLRNFHPMFNGSELRKPDDLLPIMLFYSQDPRLWPSMHGRVSRCNEDGVWVCDLVLEVDMKKSRARSFNLSRPIVKLLCDLDIEFRMKFSGNASPHIIIPSEAFPEKYRTIRKCRNIYGKLLEFFRGQIKQPKTLDGSFRNPNHFLRMPYSLNENTGLVSLPINVEEFERFSWEMARPETAAVRHDWWSVSDISEDAAEKTEALIDIALGRKVVIAMNAHRRDSAQETLSPQMPDVLGTPVQMGMVRAGAEIAARGNALMAEPSMQDALSELRASAAEGDQDAPEPWKLARSMAQKHGIDRDSLQLLWQWSDNVDALAHYSRPDVQEAIYSYARGRCVLMEGTDEYIVLNDPSDVPALAAYMVGGGVAPAFRCTNARYDPDSGKMTACDMVIRADRELSNSVALLLRGFDMPSFALYGGNNSLQIVIPFRVLEAGIDSESPMSRLPSVAEGLRRHLRRMLKAPNGVSVSLNEGLIPVPYSLTDGDGKVELPVKLERVHKLAPDIAHTSAVGEIQDMESFIPPDAGAKAARFLKDMVM